MITLKHKTKNSLSEDYQKNNLTLKTFQNNYLKMQNAYNQVFPQDFKFLDINIDENTNDQLQIDDNEILIIMKKIHLMLKNITNKITKIIFIYMDSIGKQTNKFLKLINDNSLCFYEKDKAKDIYQNVNNIFTKNHIKLKGMHLIYNNYSDYILNIIDNKITNIDLSAMFDQTITGLTNLKQLIEEISNNELFNEYKRILLAKINEKFYEELVEYINLNKKNKNTNEEDLQNEIRNECLYWDDNITDINKFDEIIQRYNIFKNKFNAIKPQNINAIKPQNINAIKPQNTAIKKIEVLKFLTSYKILYIILPAGISIFFVIYYDDTIKKLF